MLFKSKKVIGLDIGTSSIKVVELDVSRSSATLKNFSILETPLAAVSSGDIIDIQVLADSIREVVERANIKIKETSTGLWGSSVVVKKISIPKMDKKLVSEQIKWEAEQYIPYDISEVNLDFQFLSSSSDGPDSMDLLLIAARKDQILKYMEILELADQNLSIIDANGFALSNCFEFNYGRLENQHIAILNIGAYFTNFIVKAGSDLIFCRDIPVGGALYTSEIQKSMNVSFQEAESLKLSSHQANAVPEDVINVVQSTHEPFCDEIVGSFEFFNNTNPGANISKVYVTGGGSRTPHILQQLAQSLQLECVIFDPLKKIKCPKSLGANFKHQYGDFMSTVVGLGLRKLGDQ